MGRKPKSPQEIAPKPVPAPKESPAFFQDPAECNEFAALKKRVSDLEERETLRKAQMGDMRVTLVCVLEAVSAVEKSFGVKFMQRGEFYGVQFE